MGEAKMKKDKELEFSMVEYDIQCSRYRAAADKLENGLAEIESAIKKKWFCFGIATGLMIDVLISIFCRAVSQ